MSESASPFRRLQHKWGITDEQMAAGLPLGEEWISHEEFERRQPGFLADATNSEVARVERWRTAHGSLEGYRPGRLFPCPGTLRVEDMDAVMWEVECDACGFEVGVRQVDAAPERALKGKLERAGLPEQFIGKPYERTQDNDGVVMVTGGWIRSFKSEQLPAPALWGEPGRGKTHLLVSLCQDLVLGHGVDVMYRSAIDFFDGLQAAIDTGGMEVIFERACTVPVLALDDLGSERRTEWQQDRFQQLVDRRYRAERPILIGTNVPPAQWSKVFGDRAASRLSGMVRRLRLAGPDRRLGQGVQEELVA